MTLTSRTRRAAALRSRLEALPDQPASPRRPLAWALDRTIALYQRRISAGRNLCSFGPDRSCSRIGRRAAGHWGAFRGTLAILAILSAPRVQGNNSCLRCH